MNRGHDDLKPMDLTGSDRLNYQHEAPASGSNPSRFMLRQNHVLKLV